MIAGIDNGLDGGIVWLDSTGKIVSKLVMPTLEVGTHRAYNIGRVVLEFKANPTDEVFLEYAQAMPGQGVRSMFMTGYGFGVMEGILVALGISYTIVRPRRWQETFFKDMPKDDTGKLSALVCQRRWPTVDWRKSDKARVPHLGLTDAALLAAYGLELRKNNDTGRTEGTGPSGGN
jgi:hypothetical protein